MAKTFNPASLPLTSLEWTPFVPLIGKANAALARYDGILHGISNPSVFLSPLTTQEAVLSSKIEGTQATLTEVLEYEAEPKKKTAKYNDIREIINYRNAMTMAVDSLENRPISLNLVKSIQGVLLDSVRGENKGRGKFRKEQNWIGKPGAKIEEATFVPPDPTVMMEYLYNLESYIHFDEKDRLVQLAIIHAQFEMIHPFVDGNGRVGRILVPLFLYEKGMLSNPMFYISEYLEKNRDEYCAKLQSISENRDWEGWILFFLMAIAEQAKSNSDKAKAVLELHEKIKSEIAELIRTQFSIPAIDTLFGRAIFTTTDFVTRSGIPKNSAMRILDKLQEAEILFVLREGRGRLPALLMFKDLITITEGKKFV